MTISFPSTAVNNDVSFFLDFEGMLTRDQSTVYREDLLVFRDKTDNTAISVADNGGGFLQAINSNGLYTGNKGYLSTTYNSALQLGTNPYTIEFIFLTPGFRASITESILSVGATAASNNWEIGIDNLGRPFFIYGTTTETATSATITDDIFQHIAIVRTGTGSNETKMYLNGVAIRTFTDATDYNYTDGLYIGSGRDGSGSTQIYFKNIRISTVAQYTEDFTAPNSFSYVAVGDTYSYLDKTYKWNGVKWFDRSKYNANLPGEYRNYAAVSGSANTTTLDLRSANFFEVNLVVDVDTEVIFENEALSQSFIMRADQAIGPITLGWSIDSASYTEVNVLASIPADTYPWYFYFKPDGSKLYFYGANTGVVYEWNLSTPWLITTAVYSGSSFTTVSQDNQVYGMFFKPDGTKMYIVGAQYSSVREYNLSTPWSILTAALSATFSVSGQLRYAGDMFFKPDGTKMYIPNLSTGVIFEYNLSAPWSISTASYSGTSLSVVSQGTPTSLSFSPDGTRMHTVVDATDNVFQYNLTTPWLISSATYNSVNFPISSQATTFGSIRFKTEGDKMYILSRINNDARIYEYSSLHETTALLDQTITWPSNIIWSTGTPPSITGTTLIEFYKYNGTWHGNVITETL